jgi:hypothetical protein
VRRPTCNAASRAAAADASRPAADPLEGAGVRETGSRSQPAGATGSAGMKGVLSASIAVVAFIMLNGSRRGALIAPVRSTGSACAV